MEQLNEEQKKELEIKEVKDKITEILNIGEVEELIKSNEKIFEENGITYRVKKPDSKQKKETYEKKIEKFTELLRNDKFVLEKDLKELYLKRGIDIDGMTKKIREKMNSRDDLMFRLGEAIKNKAPIPDLETFKKEIQSLNEEIQDLSIEKTRYLEASIEQQVMIHTYSYLTYLIGEKKEGDNWVRIWNSWDEFENDKDKIANRVSYYCTLMSSIE